MIKKLEDLKEKLSGMERSLKYIAIICLLYLICHQLLLQFSAPFNWLYTLGILFQTLSLSYIAAFIFYLLQIYIPYRKNKRNYKPVIYIELSGLWEICNAFTYALCFNSNTSVNPIKPNTCEIQEQFRKLPVRLNKTNQINNKAQGDRRIQIVEMDFYKWSEAAEHVHSSIVNTLNIILNLRDVVDEETLLKILDMKKAIYDFRIVSKSYEEKPSYETFEYARKLQNEFIKFYQGTAQLHKYYENPRRDTSND